jgi:cell division protein FtsZ
MTNIEMVPDFSAQPKIKVVGVGGAGGNAVNRMITDGLEDVEFITLNTDAAALEANQAPRRIQIGEKLTGGLGAGANPEVGKAAAEETRDEIAEQLENTEMVFIAAGMGGGTGTGAAGVVAEIAKEKGALTVAVVTKPFLFEGKVRDRNAKYGIDELRKHVDSIIVVENQKLLAIADPDTTIMDSFKVADGVLNDATSGISNLITIHGFINVDFADVKAIMTDMGDALMGVGESEDSSNRAVIAAEQAIKSPLLADIDITGAQGLLVNFTSGPDLSLLEIEKAHQFINDAVGDDSETNIIFGAIIDPEMNGKVTVTVVATGFNKKPKAVSPLANTQKSTPVSSPVQSTPVAQPEQTEINLDPTPAAPENSASAAPANSDKVIVDAAEATTVTEAPVQESTVSVSQAPTQQQESHVVQTQVAPVQEQPVQQSAPVSAPQTEQVKADSEYIGNNLEAPAWSRKRDDNSANVVSKDHNSGEYHLTGGTFPGTGNMGDIETPAFLRKQMQ